MYGKKLKELRKEAGFTQEDIAIKTGFPQSSISYWEKAQYPPLDFIVETLKLVKPNLKLWEFFIETDSDLKDYVPSYLKKRPEWIPFIQSFENSLTEEQKKLILHGFIDIVKAAKK